VTALFEKRKKKGKEAVSWSLGRNQRGEIFSAGGIRQGDPKDKGRARENRLAFLCLPGSWGRGGTGPIPRVRKRKIYQLQMASKHSNTVWRDQGKKGKVQRLGGEEGEALP